MTQVRRTLHSLCFCNILRRYAHPCSALCRSAAVTPALQRGVREHESDMTTAIMMGEFLSNGSLRKEFYDICFSMKGHL